MITYKAMFIFDEDGVHAQILDFPGAISCGKDLEEARHMIASALEDLAESYILEGLPLPLPDPTINDPDADLVEPVHLLVTGTSRVVTLPLELARELIR